MLNLIGSYISNFKKRAGNYILIATIFSRILSLLSSWIALQLIEKTSLGIVLFSYNIILFLLPISGLGLPQSLIRFSALTNNKNDKNTIFLYVLKYGFIASIFIIILIIVSSFIIPFQFIDAQYYMIILSFLILPTFLFEIIRAQLRLNYDNKNYAYSEFIYSFLLLAFVTVLSYFYKELGYALALIAAPFLTSLFFIKKIKIIKKPLQKTPLLNFSFWKYGFFASLSNVVTQLLIVVDILLIGFLLNNAELVTNYRYISLIPFSLLFIPRVFITTDFVIITEKIRDKKYILNYIKGYLSFFSVVSLIILFVCVIFSSQILSFFDDTYIIYTSSFIILIIGVIGIFMLRNIFGNLLSSLGHAKANYYIALICVGLNICSNYYLIPKFGILGASITTAFLMWFSGLLSAIYFYYLYKKTNA